ncbi:MAG: SCO family protein [Pseudomonadota bacterium]
MKKIVIAWLVCVLGLVGLFGWVGGSVFSNPRGADGSAAAPLITAEFTLQGGKGKTVTAQDFRGRYMLVYFGFTHCPDICPTTLLLMNNVVNQLGKNADRVQPIFITVDPERDTPASTTEYASHFGPRVLGLSGTPAQIKAAADSFKVYYSKVEDKTSAMGYVMDHSGFIYLMGPDGKYVTHFTHGVSEQELAEGLASYVK